MNNKVESVYFRFLGTGFPIWIKFTFQANILDLLFKIKIMACQIFIKTYKDFFPGNVLPLWDVLYSRSIRHHEIHWFYGLNWSPTSCCYKSCDVPDPKNKQRIYVINIINLDFNRIRDLKEAWNSICLCHLRYAH